METNFFQQIADLDLTGILKITIAKTDDNKLAISVLLVNDHCGDNARKIIPPIQLLETPEEFDKGFFSLISQPIQKTNQIFLNMESYCKQQDEALKQSKMNKEKDNKTKTEKPQQPVKTDREKKYDAAMKKVEELVGQNKFREAWCKVPDPNEYPEKAEEIRTKKDELYNKFEQPALF